MRRGIAAAALALGLAGAGCSAFAPDTGGGTGEVDPKKEQTKAGSRLGKPYDFIEVSKIAVDGAKKSVKFVLRNTLAKPMDSDLSLDVLFAFRAPADSFAPYVPTFDQVDVDILKGNESSKEIESTASSEAQAELLFVQLQAGGGEVRSTVSREASQQSTRAGTPLLAGQVECVDVKADLTAEKPWIVFKVVNAQGKPLEGVRYSVKLYKNGAEYAGTKGPPKSLNLGPTKGDVQEVRIEVPTADLPAGTTLAGASYQLRLKKPQQ